MTFDRKDKTDQTLLDFYQRLLFPRLVEEKMLILLRQGRISKWFSGIGQEAIAVGATLAMAKDEYILPMHRNLGVFTTRDVPLQRLMAQWQGKLTGFTKGRDRSFHFGTKAHHLIGMISHLGPQLALADGIALADVLRGTPKATLVFTGEGGTSEGDFHEALNLAAVWDLPVIFLIENNGYGLSTPVSEQYRCQNLVDKAAGYGMKGMRIDGNNLLEVYDTIHQAATGMRLQPGPVLIECMTFRMRGHEEASGMKYVPADLVTEWELKDPLLNFEAYLLREGVLSGEKIAGLKAEYRMLITIAIEAAFLDPEPEADPAVELGDMYAPGVPPVAAINFREQMAGGEIRQLRFLDAITEALTLAMQHDPQVILMGQDIAGYGGAFKVTAGLLERFGPGRVRNTPICESAVVGTALGLSIQGYKAVVEMQFADFVSCGFNQIVNNLAKIHYRWGEKADVVIRMPTGAGTGAGPFHSQSNEAWFTKTPGLKIVYPAFPEEAKGLLLAAIADPNTVLFFEHKSLYRSLSGQVPENYYTLEIGKAIRRRTGTQFTIITYGMGVHWGLDYLDTHLHHDAILLDLCSLQPWDQSAVRQAVAETGRVLILHEDTLSSGFGAELAAWIAEHCFNLLDAPVLRCASLDTAVPMHHALEKQFLASSRLVQRIDQLLAY